MTSRRDLAAWNRLGGETVTQRSDRTRAIAIAIHKAHGFDINLAWGFAGTMVNNALISVAEVTDARTISRACRIPIIQAAADVRRQRKPGAVNEFAAAVPFPGSAKGRRGVGSSPPSHVTTPASSAHVVGHSPP